MAKITKKKDESKGLKLPEGKVLKIFKPHAAHKGYTIEEMFDLGVKELFKNVLAVKEGRLYTIAPACELAQYLKDLQILNPEFDSGCFFPKDLGDMPQTKEDKDQLPLDLKDGPNVSEESF